MPVNGLDIATNCYLVQGTSFEVDQRYKILEPTSTGAQGIVCSALDQVTEQSVAVKKIEGVFEHVTITKRTLRELRILRHLQHENLVQIKSIFIPQTKDVFEEIYIISELMETDLASTLRSSQPLSDDHCQFFLYQILRGIKYVHSAQVIHRDLKPRNLLVNSNCDLKICDFGLSRVFFQDKTWVCPMTEYVCTRWYRAPEVLCSWTDYSYAIDVWSIGCILAELLIRKPLFPGINTQHQLDLIIDVLGVPNAEELNLIPNEKVRKFIKSCPTPEHHCVMAFAAENVVAQDLLRKTLCWNSTKRMSVEEALEHMYLERLHCPEDEPIRLPIDTTDFEFERRKINSRVLREEIFKEALNYYPELMARFQQEHADAGVNSDFSRYRLLVPGESQYGSSDEED